MINQDDKQNDTIDEKKTKLYKNAKFDVFALLYLTILESAILLYFTENVFQSPSDVILFLLNYIVIIALVHFFKK